MAVDNESVRMSSPDQAQLAALVTMVEQVDEDLAYLAAGTQERLDQLKASAETPSDGDGGPGADDEPEVEDRALFPLAVVLTHAEYEQWEACKETLGTRADKDAVLAMMDLVEVG